MSSDAPPSLYAAREPVFPRRVKGFYRSLKWWLMGFTLAIYYITPWIRWDRGESAPDQAVLIDLAHRRFYFFWIEIWPHEFYFVAGLLVMAGLGLFLFTSALGRVWCGYACPQTVWTDLFILVERWVEGDRNARVRLHKAPLSMRKAILRVEKWFIWVLIALGTGGAWVFYFANAPTLAVQLVTLSAPMVAYATIGVLALTTFIFGGFAREQICIYMCPWPRIQAAMMDQETLTIGYRHWRGEPRGKHRKAEGADQLGDCIDCMACVNVCPMGIDIRDGQQMECITCGLCIDACDDIMVKTGRERGLVDYMALADEPREKAGKKPRPLWAHVARPRTMLYFLLWAAIGFGLVYALFIRTNFELLVSPVRNPTFVVQSDGSVRNIYDFRVRNMQQKPRDFSFAVGDSMEFLLEIEGADRNNVITVPADSTYSARAYVTAPNGTIASTSSNTKFRFWIVDVETGDQIGKSSQFNGHASE